MRLLTNFLKTKLICILRIHNWTYTYDNKYHYHGSGRFRFCQNCYKREEETTPLDWSNGDTTWLKVPLDNQQKRELNILKILEEES